MGYGYAYNGPPSKCHTGARPGTLALGKWAKARWALPLIGTFNCRKSRAGSSISLHGDGRAVDLHTHTGASEANGTKAQDVLGWEIARFLVRSAEALGVQRVIFQDKEWDSRPGQREFLPYSGPFHGNHVHVELCSAAAGALTIEAIEAATGGVEDDLNDAEKKLMFDALDEMVRRVRAMHAENWKGGTLDWADQRKNDVIASLAPLIQAQNDPAKFAAEVAAHLPGSTADEVEAAVRRVFADAGT